MIILSKMDYEGDNLEEDLKKLKKIHDNIEAELKSGKVEGPFFPQDASLLYIFHVDEYDWLNRSGRIWIRNVAKESLPFVPKSYEVAVTPEEFFGK
ncbi:MAG: hypothetical protein JRN15_06510 [Nitrososphaerota archaeon]|nr:hypothetical protein [Nitrososphaerota archaeon]